MTHLIVGKKSIFVLLVIILFSLLLNFYFYPKLPTVMVTHWNMQGEADGYSPKLFGIFLFPVLLTFLFFMSMVIPRIDPLKKNMKTFQLQYMSFITVFFAFILYIQTMTIAWNIGLVFDFVRFLTPAFTVLFFYLGILMKETKRNWFIGIRTPWTLSSDVVWEKTHALASTLFKTAAIIALGGVIFPTLAIWFMLIPILSSSLMLVVYSYIVFRKQ